MARGAWLVAWGPVAAVAIAAVVAGYLVGRGVERLGPIDYQSVSAQYGVVNAAVAGVAAALAIAWRRDRSWLNAGLVGLGACTVVGFGNVLAFDEFAGPRDCPYRGDCDTLLVPYLAPLWVPALASAVVATIVVQVTVLRRRA